MLGNGALLCLGSKSISIYDTCDLVWHACHVVHQDLIVATLTNPTANKMLLVSKHAYLYHAYM